MLSQPEGAETAGSSILYYAVPSARDAEAALAAEAVPFDQPATSSRPSAEKQVWLAIARDSEGNLIGLMSEETAG